MLKKYLASDFIRNILTLMTGAVIAQAIPFLASPLLTRLYTPTDFGIFALYTAIVGTAVVVSSLRYELAIMLPKEQRDARSLTFLSGLLTVGMALLSFVLILIFKNYLIEKVNSDLDYFIWIVPVGLLFSGLYQIMNSFSTRNKFFKSTSAGKVTQSGAIIGSQIGLKLLSFSSIGLIVGKVIGDFLAFLYLFILNIRKNTLTLATVTKQNIIENARTYKDFPKYQALSAFLNQLAQNLPALLLTFFYAPQIAGFYALTTRILSAPIRLIGMSTREVYYQKASEMHARGENIFRLYLKTTLGLAKIGIIPFILFGIFATYIFTWVFGNQWYTSGIYAQIIVAWSFFLFINSPTTTTIYILNLQRFGLKFESVSLTLRAFSLFAGYYFFDSHYLSVGFFALAGILLNLFLILYIYRKLKKRTR
ncbi:MAG: oligosaccharide flippase family protein [Bacteroidales bacterium]|nr:oligosaccharide flippase family protein [Bacteroidales bacterium]MCF8344722.1 oligosaccharide flippase family protein [Bacteroidales bacterium]MCF8350327.1 oligosaccharide flippase family protein [Bacteroidales bacterium]MCF8375969.1 oligosaccharide flippase family protein [Bacteroidales bacterium]MCF8400457.1 oligosaccharide flippase family protein [Bacteroidales bacterium]